MLTVAFLVEQLKLETLRLAYDLLRTFPQRLDHAELAGSWRAYDGCCGTASRSKTPLQDHPFDLS